MKITKTFSSIFILLILGFNFSCQSKPNAKNLKPENPLRKHYKAISLKDFSDSINHARYKYPNSIPPYMIYDEDQIAGIAENMIYLQNPDGGWNKNYDWARMYTIEELNVLKKQNENIPAVKYFLPKTIHKKASTTDNRNIYTQIKYLAQVYKQIPEQKYVDTIQKSLIFLLEAQHPTSGGFTGADVYAITFNDDVMSGILSTLRDVAYDDKLYGFLDKTLRQKAETSYKKGLDCILKTQIKVQNADGNQTLTLWSQQHDHETLEPIWAREFEPPSIVTTESVKIIEFLLQEKNPTPQIQKAIISACKWLDRDDIRIHGKKLVKIPAEPMTLTGRWSDYENVLIEDKNAPDLWARFYDIKTQKPIWCDRGKIFCENFNDLSRERRVGYSYTTTSPEKLLRKINIK